MSRPTLTIYKTRNWLAYNEALKRRGSLTIWFDPEMSWDAVLTGKRGRQQTYSDTAIQTCLTMKVFPAWRSGGRLGSSRACSGWLASIGRCLTSASVPSSEDPGRQRSLPWLEGPVPPADL